MGSDIYFENFNTLKMLIEMLINNVIILIDKVRNVFLKKKSLLLLFELKKVKLNL